MPRKIETQPSRNLRVLVHCLAESCNQQQKSSYPHKCMKAIVLGDFVAAVVKLQQFAISEPHKVHHRSKVAIQQLTAPVKTSKLELTTYYDISITSQLAKNI